MNFQKKKLNALDWIIIVIFAFFVTTTPVWMLKSATRDRSMHANQIEALFGNISFSGKVVGFHCVKHSGMPLCTAILCIQIDSSNVDSFYQFDKYTALKIEKGMATLPIGLFDKTTEDTLYKNVIRVNINELRSHKMLFITAGNDTIVDSLYYTSVGLKEYDLGICDSCRNEE